MTENAAIQAVAEAIRRTVGAVETHGPAAVELAGTYLQFYAIFSLTISAAVIGSLVYLICKLVKWATAGIKEEEKTGGDAAGYVLAIVCGGGILSVAVFILTLVNLMDFSLWVSIWSPELALTAKAVSLLK